MKKLQQLFENNKVWAEEAVAHDPQFFSRLANQQSPEYLWIGCSDSRVPANQIVNLLPGEVFVHRNIANLVQNADLNCMSVVQYAVEVLKVKHIMVVGHYGCGGVTAALEDRSIGVIDFWVWNIKLTAKKHQDFLDTLKGQERINALCELNVIEQVYNLVSTMTIKSHWDRGGDLTLHGWVYGLDNGLLRDLDICISGGDDTDAIYRNAVEGVAQRYS